MTPFLFDSETWPIAPGLQAPPVVCGQWQTVEGPRVALAREYRQRLIMALSNGERMAGHYTAFDMAAAASTWPDLIPLIFQAYADDKVTCTFIREKLLLVAAGREHSGQKYDLASCLDRAKVAHRFNIGADGKKDEYWRTRYSELRSIEPESWPEDARRYAREDVTGLVQLYQHQEKHAPAGWLKDQHRRARADFWLTLASCHGLRVDQDHVHRLSQQTNAESVTLKASLLEAKLVRPNGVKDTKRARLRMFDQRKAQDLPIPLTPGGKEAKKEKGDDFEGMIQAAVRAYRLCAQDKESTKALEFVATTVDDCRETGDQTLIDYARYGSLSKLKGRIRRLAAAGNLPIQTRFNAVLKTGRTSSTAGKSKAGDPLSRYGDQIQNLDRAAGVRECYIARPGFVLLSVDYSAAELHTLAQVCLYLGLDSQMAKILRSGKDVHMWFGALMKGWSYEWAQEARKGMHGPENQKAAKDARQMAKAANFGFPGGLGVRKFRLFALGTYGVKLTDQEAKDLKAAWFAAFPEMPEYFDHVNELIESGEPLQHFTSGRFRGGASYCAACNSYFQGLAADMALDAGFDVSRECYTGAGVLFGSRIVNFIHDELLLEVPEALAHECAERVVHLMEAAGRRWCPGVSPGAEPALSRRWRKKAEPVYSVDKRLIPWEDRDLSGEQKKDAAGNLRPVLELIQEERKGGDLIPLSWKYGIEVERILAA